MKKRECFVQKYVGFFSVLHRLDNSDSVHCRQTFTLEFISLGQIWVHWFKKNNDIVFYKKKKRKKEEHQF